MPLPSLKEGGQGLGNAIFKTNRVSVVLCKNPESGKYLAVSDIRGWSLPQGYVDDNETFKEAAIRETMEEARIQIELKGLLKISHQTVFENGENHAMQFVVFYAEPIDVKAQPKLDADFESLGAKWVTIEEF